MRSQFDGLRSILGDSTVPVVDAPAVEEPAVGATPVDTFADLPDLSDLDRGLYKGDSQLAQPDSATAFRALSAHAAGHHPQKCAERASSMLSTWTAVAVIAIGLVLGGSAAMAVFHVDVTHILR